MYYIFVKNDDIIGSGETPLLNEDIKKIEVSEEIYNKYNNDNDSVIWDAENEDIVDNPEYEEIKASQREQEFHSQFFHTSLGYIRRQARMKDGKTKDFISDLIPLMESTPGIPIIAYKEPDFTKEVTEDVLIGLQVVVTSSPEFIKECKDQAIVDFYGYNPIELLALQQQEEPIEEEPIEEPTEGELTEEPTEEEPVEEELDNVEE